jgi:hypothetical protein
MKLTFIINTNEEPTIDRCLNFIRASYPDDNIITIPDIDFLKNIINGGAWTLRYLNAFMATDGDILIRMDPDSLMLRPFAFIPETEYFGMMFADQYIHGGCKGYSRSYVQRIIDSELLLLEKYKGNEYKCGNTNLVSCDLVCMDIAITLNATISNWTEVSSMPYCEHFAVTHGHKT